MKVGSLGEALKLNNPLYWVLGTLVMALLAGGLAYGLVMGKLGRYGAYIVAGFVVALVWTAWPYWAIYDLQTALLNGDKVRLASRVDWTSVRDGVRDDLKAAYSSKIVAIDPRMQTLSEAYSRAAIDSVVEQQINPEALSAMAQSGANVSEPMAAVRYAFFQGSPLVFRMDLGATFSTQDERTIYLLEWNFGWRLKRIIVAPYLLKGLG